LENSIGKGLDRFGNKLSDIVLSIPDVDASAIQDAYRSFEGAMNDLNDKIPGIAGKASVSNKKE